MDVTAGEMAIGRRAAPRRLARLAIEALLAATVLALWAGAFVGLGATGYWIDELWTLFAAAPSGGLGEVIRRALTDTNPPLHFVLVHYWIRLFGDGEAATRSFSAVCAVAAGAVFALGARRAFSRPARLFAIAAGAGSFYWFKQSQNVRAYALAMLILAGLFACAAAAKRASRDGRPTSWSLCAAVAALGLLGAFTHYYLFIAVGLVYLALLVGVPDLRLRASVLAAGLAILAAVLGYMRLERSHLLFTNLWFSNAPAALAAALRNAWEMAFDGWAKAALLVLALGALLGFRRGRPEAAAGPTADRALGDWLAGVALFVSLGLAAAGLAVSLLVQPSFSARNLMIAAPALWILAAWLYDRALESGPRAGLAVAGAASVLAALQVGQLPGRLLVRTEDWRGSARYVSALAACRGREIPVVLPDIFGPNTPFFRRLAEQDLFGWYYRGGGRLVARTRQQLAGARDAQLVALLGARAGGADPCPVLAWGVHDIHDAQADALAQALARRPEVSRPVAVRRFLSYRRVGEGWRPGWPDAYVFEVAPRPPSP
jgi:uncharacterized membrane protein